MSRLVSPLDGLGARPFFLRPETYDLMIYPAEWYGALDLAVGGGGSNQFLGECSDIFYQRSYGRANVYNLWTLFVRAGFLHWFEDDVSFGYRNMVTDANPDELANTFYTEALTLLQSAKLKELRTDLHTYRQTVDAYTAIPLLPAVLTVSAVESLSLQEAVDPAALTARLEEFKNFLN
jgi:hypothetical protein